MGDIIKEIHRIGLESYERGLLDAIDNILDTMEFMHLKAMTKEHLKLVRAEYEKRMKTKHGGSD